MNELPSPAERMSEGRAAAALPTSLSFARSAMRLLVRGRWRLEKVRLELDADGRGEVLYRLHGDGHVFHFFLVSDKLPEAMKTTPMGPPIKASHGASAAPGGMRPPTMRPMTVNTPKPTIWFQNEAISGEFDRLRRPLT